MIIIQNPALLRSHLQKQKAYGLTTGFVPTMGALHEGHLSLIHQSLHQAALTICSIFVNPTQFNDPSDYSRYPNRVEKDIHLLERAGTSVLYLPPVHAIYEAGTENLERYDLGYLETILEGKYRPGHFQGVCQVMSRLMKAVDPDMLFMGQKDYQQCLVVKKLLTLIHSDARFVTCDTQRESDGLAMSSRNLRLSAADREKAPLIYQSLLHTRNNLAPGNLAPLKARAFDDLSSSGFKVDYFEIATADRLVLLDKWDGHTPIVALTAAFLGEVRLIDNLVLTPAP